ncbi:MAG: glycosyltransferase [Bacteroidales bacterium]|nr:glycosyltransferase [Bacteroidales bacterium]
MKRLSIIIPMYNVASYVERCIRSLEDQNIPKEDYELICINDGSPDNCKEIIEQLQTEFPNIELIDQENQGVSMARNNGIDKARGKYLLFIDPDDYVDPNCFARVLLNIEQKKAQVSFLGFSFLNEDGSLRKARFNQDHSAEVYTGIDAYYIARGDGQTDPDRVWAVLFQREFLDKHDLRFLADVLYLEDGEFIARIMCLAERCVFDGNSFYQRTTRPGSATHSNLFGSERALNGFIRAARNLKEFQNAHDLTKTQKDFLNQPVIKFIVLAYNSCINKFSFKKCRFIRAQLTKSNLTKCEHEGVDKFYMVYSKAYNFSPFLLLIVIFLRQRSRVLSRR